jgi:hypothetical protein
VAVKVLTNKHPENTFLSEKMANQRSSRELSQNLVSTPPQYKPEDGGEKQGRKTGNEHT